MVCTTLLSGFLQKSCLHSSAWYMISEANQDIIILLGLKHWKHLDKNSSRHWCLKHTHFSMLILYKSTTIERISSLFSIPVAVKLLGFFVLIWGTLFYTSSSNSYSKKTPLADLPGPPSPSWLYGNTQQIGDHDILTTYERWTTEYDNKIKYRALFGVSVLLVSLLIC